MPGFRSNSRNHRTRRFARADAFESFAQSKGLSRLNVTKLPKNPDELRQRLKDGVGLIFDSTEVNSVVIKLLFRFRGTANPIGQIIKKFESRWIDVASKNLVDVLGITMTQATIFAEKNNLRRLEGRN